jgi:hypothetical protein
MRARKKTRGALIGLAIVGFSALAVPSASASPTGCSTHQQLDRTVFTVCTGGSGQYRARGACFNGLLELYYYGSWVSAPNRSTAFCGSGTGNIIPLQPEFR